VNEVADAPTETVQWHFNARPGGQLDVGLVLRHVRHVTEQTGVTFTEETRPMRVLTVEEAR